MLSYSRDHSLKLIVLVKVQITHIQVLLFVHDIKLSQLRLTFDSQ